MTPTAPQYLTVSRRALDVEDYIDIVRRHVSWILGPLFAGLVIACITAFSLPNTYVSKAVMRISPSQISEGLVPSTVNQQMNERIGQMQQDILSRNSLSELIQRPALNLYKQERETKPLYDIIEQFRNNIRVQFVSLPGQGNRPVSAFQIEFAYPDKYKAQAVVQALITRFTESMVTVTGQTSKVTSDFFDEEIKQAKTEVDRLDTELTSFRVQNAGHLPEELQVNLQALNSLQGQMGGINDALTRLSEEKLTLETNLQTLKSQRDTYASMVSTMSEPGSAARIQNDRLGQLNREIAESESQLLQLQQIYTETYPPIRNVKAQLALKRKERDELQLKEDQEALKPKPASAKKVSPLVAERMNEIQGSINMVNTQLQNKETERLQRLKQLDDVNKSLAVYQSRISQVPTNQQKYVALMREHELATARYVDLQRKDTAVSTFDRVGKRKAGENLEVLDIASLPESPTAPNRPMIMGIGAGLGFMLGVFLTGVKEIRDTSLKNLKDVRAYTNLPILSSVPLLENDVLVRRKRRLTYVAWTASIILGLIAMSGSMYYHYFVKLAS